MQDHHPAPEAEVSPFGALTPLKLLVFIVMVLAWRLFLSAELNLLPDECSYWTWSRRLAWSYFDNSGMAAYLIRLSTELLGSQSPWAVRLPFNVLGIAGAFLLYRTSVILFQDRVRGLIAVAALSVTPMGLLAGSAAVHDNALMFFWIASLWASAKWLRSGDDRWFYVLGLAAGLALQSKYTGALAPVCVLLFLLWAPPLRRKLLTRAPWVGVGIAAVAALPILWWNFRHDWASLHHILFIGGGAPGLLKRLGDGLGYHAAQFLLLSPLVYVMVVTGIGVGFRRNIRKPATEEILLLSFSMPLVLFGVMAFKGHVEANWAVMGYVSGIVLAVELLGRAWDSTERTVLRLFNRRWLCWAPAVSIGMTGLTVFHGFVGLLPASLEKRLGKADRIIWETHGWDGLGAQVGATARSGEIIAADTYQLCALLEYNVPGHPEVRCLAPWNRPTQFDVWNRSYENMRGRDLIFVSSRELVPSSNVRRTIYEHFTSVEEARPYETLYHGAPVRLTYVYRCRGFNPDAPDKLPARSLKYLPE